MFHSGVPTFVELLTAVLRGQQISIVLQAMDYIVLPFFFIAVHERIIKY